MSETTPFPSGGYSEGVEALNNLMSGCWAIQRERALREATERVITAARAVDAMFGPVTTETRNGTTWEKYSIEFHAARLSELRAALADLDSLQCEQPKDNQ